MPYRLAIVASHVVQYQDPFYRRLAADPALDVTVFFCSDMGARTYLDRDMATSLRWDIDLLEGYGHRFLRNFGFGDGFFRLVNPGLLPALARGTFDAVLFMTGWAWLSAWIGFAACRMSDTPFLLFGDSSFLDEPASARAKLAMAIKRALFGLAAGFMISGRWNADYYRAHGADPQRFFAMPWAADNDRFAAASRFAMGEREAMRARYGIRADETAIVFSAKLIPRKDPMTLLRALDRTAHRDRLAVIFLGEGELRPQLEVFARERNLHAVFAGFVNQTALPQHYAMGDVFCLPSLFEPRGTVINEAMAAGLPILTTTRCGPAGDIVQHGENGFVFAPGDVDALAQALDQLTDPELRQRMSERSRAIISTWNYEAGVEGVKAALQAVTRR
ncbi:MAG TPA: glycosyltransferase family 4 protein [Thermoanaerobaculia bacterium]